MQLRKLTIPGGAAFAPMAGLSDAACRRLMADHGAAWTVSEMASAKAITFGDRKSLALLRDPDPHGLYAVQLFGNEPELLGQAIGILREKGVRFDLLDLNMGCPMGKIVNNGDGSVTVRFTSLSPIAFAVKNTSGNSAATTVPVQNETAQQTATTAQDEVDGKPNPETGMMEGMGSIALAGAVAVAAGFGAVAVVRSKKK